MYEKLKTSPLLASIEYSPSKFVSVPVVVPFKTTETPGMGTEASSVTRPEIYCAFAAIISKKHAKVKSKLLCFIKFGFNNFLVGLNNKSLRYTNFQKHGFIQEDTAVIFTFEKNLL